MKKENKAKKYLIFHIASEYGHEKNHKLWLNEFAKEENEILMSENQYKETCLALASRNGHTEIVQLLLNAFSQKKEKQIEYLMKESIYTQTALHHASLKGHEKIVKILLNEFSTEYKKILIEFLMKEDQYHYGYTALNHASYKGYEES